MKTLLKSALFRSEKLKLKSFGRLIFKWLTKREKLIQIND